MSSPGVRHRHPEQQLRVRAGHELDLERPQLVGPVGLDLDRLVLEPVQRHQTHQRARPVGLAAEPPGDRGRVHSVVEVRVPDQHPDRSPLARAGSARAPRDRAPPGGAAAGCSAAPARRRDRCRGPCPRRRAGTPTPPATRSRDPRAAPALRASSSRSADASSRCWRPPGRGRAAISPRWRTGCGTRRSYAARTRASAEQPHLVGADLDRARLLLLPRGAREGRLALAAQVEQRLSEQPGDQREVLAQLLGDPRRPQARRRGGTAAAAARAGRRGCGAVRCRGPW